MVTLISEALVTASAVEGKVGFMVALDRVV